MCVCLSSFLCFGSSFIRGSRRAFRAIQNELFMLCAHVNWIHQLIAFSVRLLAAALQWLLSDDGVQRYKSFGQVNVHCIENVGSKAMVH